MQLYFTEFGLKDINVSREDNQLGISIKRGENTNFSC